MRLDYAAVSSEVTASNERALFDLNMRLISLSQSAVCRHQRWGCAGRCWVRPVLTQLQRTAASATYQLNETYKKIQASVVLEFYRRYFFHEIERIYITIKNGAEKFSIN